MHYKAHFGLHSKKKKKTKQNETKREKSTTKQKIRKRKHLFYMKFARVNVLV